MNPYFLLLPVAIMCVVGSWSTYTKWAKDAPWYTPVLVLLSAMCGLCFALAAKQFQDDKARLYVFSLSYDSVMMAAYYLLPLVAFSTRVTPGVMCGAALVAIGLIMVHTFAAD